MEQFREVKRILKNRGIEVRKIKATLNGAQAYRILGSAEHNPAAIYTAFQIRWAYQCGEFA
jgi:hypothetical protein